MRIRSSVIGLLLISLAAVAGAQTKAHKSNRKRCGDGYIPANHVCRKITPTEPETGPRKPLEYAPDKSGEAKAPAGATAKCRDGTWSLSKSRKTACAKHGGVGKRISAR
jgi:hypothetical protein